MAQWVNRLPNNIFVNLPPLPLLREIFEVIHLAQPGLMAGWLADEIQVNFEIFKVKIFDLSLRYIITALPMRIFWVKPIARLILKARDFPEAI